MAFSKYPALCELETHHGVNVGSEYTNKNAAETFCHYIAQTRREDLAQKLASANFFSILMDSTTDKGNIDDEMFLVLWCDVNGSDEKVHTKMKFFAVARPTGLTEAGLFECLQTSLQRIGISAIDAENCKQLVGIGTDGASANVASGGLKGLVEKELPWMFWTWCLAHRLELSVKDALQGTTFDLIDEMLLRLYYIYEKSPKKCHELEGVICELKQCVEFGPDHGTRPVRASGSRWVSHKLSAMKRIVSKFGAYTSHLTLLSEDPNTKSADRAKLQGYLKKWINAKYLLGCAFFTDLLLPCSIFSKVMQEDDLDVLAAFSSLLRTVKELRKMSGRRLECWPTYAATLKSLTEKNGETEYQLQALTHVTQAKEYFS